jgi:hypothetical protein
MNRNKSIVLVGPINHRMLDAQQVHVRLAHLNEPTHGPVLSVPVASTLFTLILLPLSGVIRSQRVINSEVYMEV